MARSQVREKVEHAPELVPRPQIAEVLATRTLDILICSHDRLFVAAFHKAADGHLIRWTNDLDACELAIRSLRPDVAVLDLGAVARPGYIGHLRRAAQNLPLALWVPELPVEWAVHAIDAGVLGIFLRSSEPAAVIRALGAVARGELRMDMSVLAEVVRARGVRVRERELAIAVLAETMSNKEIAGRLGISREVVKQSLHVLYSRLNVRGRAQLASVVSRNYGQWHGKLPLPLKIVLRG